MNILFRKTNAYWANYNGYEYRQGKDGNTYLMPAATATPSVYDPIKEAETLVVDALNVGRLAMKRDDEDELKRAVLEFVSKYGLLGFMAYLPTTPDFINYDAVYLPKNHFLKEEAMATQEYISLFFPFEKPDVYKDNEKAQWNISNDHYPDPMIVALAMTYADEPIAVGMSLHPFYGERLDWLVTQFRDWAFMLVSSFLFYEEENKADNLTRELYRRGVSVFGGKAPTYHISLYDDGPRIVWDFYSLLLTIQTMFGFALVDEEKPLRVCKRCNRAFMAENNNDTTCSQECGSQ
jgi:hypothetical protein